MLKSLLIAILFSLATLETYSQSTDSLNWIEVNKYLKEGVECKELLNEKNDKINTLDSLVMAQDSVLMDLAAEITEQYKIQVELLQEIKKLNTDRVKYENQIGSLKYSIERKKRSDKLWRNVGIIAATVLSLIKVF